MKALTLQDKIVVDIKDYSYIALIKKFGPQRGILLSITDIIELINDDIKVIIPEKWETQIFALITQYNQLAKNENLPTADVAEKILRSKILNDVNIKNKGTPNPFKEDKSLNHLDKRSIDITNIPDDLTKQGVGTNKRRITINRPKAHEILFDNKDNMIPATVNVDLMFDDIDFSN